MPPRFARSTGAVLLGVTVLALTGCSGGASSVADSSLARHGVSAELVVGRPPVVSAGQAAARVVGRGSDDTIEAMAARGTNRAGSLVLRITVTSSVPGFAGSTDTVARARCYRYTFGTMEETTHVRTDCPTTPPLPVAPAPGDGVRPEPGG